MLLDTLKPHQFCVGIDINSAWCATVKKMAGIRDGHIQLYN